MSKDFTYKGVQVSQNFMSINGTGRPLKSPRGWNAYLPGYGSLGWFSSRKDVESDIDMLQTQGNARIKRALEAAAK